MSSWAEEGTADRRIQTAEKRQERNLPVRFVVVLVFPFRSCS
jgi:hypothetical protein